MNNIKIILFLIIFFFAGCINDHKSLKLIGSYEMNGNDTVNVTDSQGRKQGKWIPSVNNKMTDTVYYRNDTVLSF
ncbi:MAG TPA: hypothetical protein VN026_07590 [Bacteroidia bacterium]|jgi:hypothetical protein|nr:hypothetical protein [Bacteroidia bacterium]